MPTPTARPTRIACALALTLAAWLAVPHAAAGAAPPGAALVHELLSRDLDGSPGRQVLMMTVQYLPAGASLPHRHNAQVFVYVLEGQVRMQVAGAAPVTLGPGATFYEGPQDVHAVSANASATQPARILVFIVKDTRAPVSVPVSVAVAAPERP